MPSTRALLLPVVPDVLNGLLELEDPLFLTLRNPLDPATGCVPAPGAPIADISAAYSRVLEALPAGTPELVGEAEDDLPGVRMLVGPDGRPVVHLTTIEVADADIALLAASADALDHAARPDPGPAPAALAEALGEHAQEPDCLWPEGDAPPPPAGRARRCRPCCCTRPSMAHAAPPTMSCCPRCCAESKAGDGLLWAGMRRRR
ncbi:hypothetical protein [Streptomyces uncialis]|uniref:hypothetical protein n=1 Tax=Streptomyces uncialis TaxID=1048205 RepID=UPI0033F36C15